MRYFFWADYTLQNRPAVAHRVHGVSHRGRPDRLGCHSITRNQRLVHHARLLVFDTDVRQPVAGREMVCTWKFSCQQQYDRMDLWIGSGSLCSRQLCILIFQCRIFLFIRAICRHGFDSICLPHCPLLHPICLGSIVIHCRSSCHTDGNRHHLTAKIPSNKTPARKLCRLIFSFCAAGMLGASLSLRTRQSG